MSRPLMRQSILNNIFRFRYCVFNRSELGGDIIDKKDVKEELSKSRKQMEETRLRLTERVEHGTELITSIRVAGDSREVLRRIEEEDALRQRFGVKISFIFMFQTVEIHEWIF